MIQKECLYFPTLEEFLAKKISANRGNTKYITGALDAEAVTGEPDIMFHSVVYIKSTQQIWTHGTMFGPNANDTSDSNVQVEKAERKAADQVLQEAIDSLRNEIEEGLGESLFDDGYSSSLTIGGLASGTDIGGKSAVEVLDLILSPEYAPLWTSAKVSWSKQSTYSGKVYEVGSTAPAASEITGYLICTAAKAVAGSYSAYGGGMSSSEATGSILGSTMTKVGSYTIGYSVVFSAGTDVVKSSKGNATNKTASNSTTLLSDASANSNIGSGYTIGSLTVTGSVTIYSTYAIYATTSSIGTMTKQSLSTSTTVSLAMPAETSSAKHSFAIPYTYGLSSVKVLNTLSGKYETYDTSKFTITTESYTIADGSSVAYKRYTRNDGTNGATTFQLTFTRA